MSETKQSLTRARELIAAGWTQDTYARNKTGGMVDVNSPNACSYCLTGAIVRATIELGTLEGPPRNSMKKALRDEFSYMGADASLAQYNDHDDRTQADVLAAFDKAIAAE